MEIQLSKHALSEARALAIKAVNEDNWLKPCPEEHLGDGDDVGTISDSHREGWQETTHWQILYGNPLSEIADKEEFWLTNGECNLDGLVKHEGLVVPLRDAFWEAWEEGSKFYDLANKAIEDK